MQGLIGKKIGMTTFFMADGAALPVTVIEAGPCPVVQVKTEEKEGYNALQLGFEEMKTKFKTVFRNRKKVKKNVRPGKPMEGHFKKAGTKPLRHLMEFRQEDLGQVKAGDEFKVDMFEVNERVDVTGTSKGRGFAGVIKRWSMGGGGGSHGSMFHRRGGSVGNSSNPSKIWKNMKMPGHYGAAQITVQNLQVVKVDVEKNVILVKGAVPGANGRIVFIRKAAKK
jgi:large subunit ribosomal protein L3